MEREREIWTMKEIVSKKIRFDRNLKEKGRCGAREIQRCVRSRKEIEKKIWIIKENRFENLENFSKKISKKIHLKRCKDTLREVWIIKENRFEENFSKKY